MDLVSDLSEEMSNDPIVIQYLFDRDMAVKFYQSITNMRWKKINAMSEDEYIMDRLKGIRSDVCSYSWRAAGRIISDIRNTHYGASEDYMDFYCSGGEGVVDSVVEECFKRMGWEPYPWDDYD